MKVFGAYILTFKNDFKYCIATISSVKKYNPNLPITLIVDGEFDLPTKALKKSGVSVIKINEMPKPYKSEDFTGWGYGKLLPFFYGPYDRFIVLDADTIAIGSLMPFLVNKSEFVSSKHIPLQIEERREETISECFFAPDFADEFFEKKWRDYIDNLFVSGVFVAQKGLLDYTDYKRLRDIQNKNSGKIFPGDQGILNMWLIEKLIKDNLETDVMDFQRIIYAFIKKECTDKIYYRHMKAIKANDNIEQTMVYHWAGNTKAYAFNIGTYWQMVFHFRKEFLIDFSEMGNFKATYTILKSDAKQSFRKLYSVLRLKLFGR